MNIFVIVVVAVVALVVAMIFYSRRQQTNTASSGKEQYNVDRLQAGKSSAAYEKLSPNDAQKWLDDFLVKQQKKE